MQTAVLEKLTHKDTIRTDSNKHKEHVNLKRPKGVSCIAKLLQVKPFCSQVWDSISGFFVHAHHLLSTMPQPSIMMEKIYVTYSPERDWHTTLLPFPPFFHNAFILRCLKRGTQTMLTPRDG